MAMVTATAAKARVTARVTARVIERAATARLMARVARVRARAVRVRVRAARATRATRARARARARRSVSVWAGGSDSEGARTVGGGDWRGRVRTTVGGCERVRGKGNGVRGTIRGEACGGKRQLGACRSRRGQLGARWSRVHEGGHEFEPQFVPLSIDKYETFFRVNCKLNKQFCRLGFLREGLEIICARLKSRLNLA